MVINPIPTQVKQHSIHYSDLLYVSAVVHWRLVGQVLNERHMESHFCKFFLIGMGCFKDFGDCVSMVVEKMQNGITSGQDIVTHQLYLSIVYQIY